MKRKPALLLALSLYSVPPSVSALGLGDIELRSSLNQPLEARIALKSWQSGELEDLKVNLAGQEHFDRAGVEQVPGLSELAFQVVESTDGDAYIEVSTKSDFREPFLDFLVEVSWPQGRVLREYTLLLDPPLYGAAVAESLKRASATGVVEAGPGSLPEKSSRKTTEQTSTTAAAPASPSSKEGTGEALQTLAPTSTSSSSVPVSGVERALTYGPTAAGDTLWQVSSEIVDDSPQDLNQLMLALFRSNPDAFLEKNMNLLKKGVVLQIPDPMAVSTIESSEALAEVRRHHGLWEEYRQVVAARMDKLPAGALAGTEMASDLPGQNEAAVTGERVKLVSAGSASSGGGSGAEVGGGVEGLHNALALATEEAEATKRENQDLRERLGDAETIIKDLRRLIELKDDTISSLQHQLAADGNDLEVAPGEAVDDLKAQASDTSEAGVSPSAEDGSASKVRAATDLVPETLEQDPTAASGAVQNIGAEETQETLAVAPELTVDQHLAMEGVSTTDNVRQQAAPTRHSAAIGIGLFGGLLVAGSGFAMWRRRRARTASLRTADALLLEGDAASIDASELAVIDTEGTVPTEARAEEDSKAVPADSGADQDEVMPPSEAGLRDEDPLAEVNVYLAYERFEQAEQLVKEAIQNYPSRQEYKLKLLEIFAASKNPDAFEMHARALRDAVGDENPLMERALAWWRDLCPDRDLFAGNSGEQDAISIGERDEEADLSGKPSVDFLEEGDASVGSDTVHLKPREGTASDGHATSEMDLDFDLGSVPTGGEDSTERTEGTVDFDLGLEGVAASHDLDRQDGLDFGLADSAIDGRRRENTQEIDVELDFNLYSDTVDSSTATEGTIDFDLGGLELGGSSSPSVSHGAEESGSDETVDLDYSFGDSDAEQPADELEPLDLAKLSEEGTVDFDLGLAEVRETVRTNTVETVDPTSTPDMQWRQAEAGKSVDDRAADNRVGRRAPPDGDELGALPMDDTGDKLDLSYGDEDTQEAVGSSEDLNVVGDVDLEIDPEGLIQRDESDATVKAELAIGRSSGAEATESLPQDKILDEWASLDSEPGNEGDRTLVLGKELSQDLDEIQTKLELAQAYMDMGDAEGARSILDEVMSEGDYEQKEAAKELINKMA